MMRYMPPPRDKDWDVERLPHMIIISCLYRQGFTSARKIVSLTTNFTSMTETYFDSTKETEIVTVRICVTVKAIHPKA